MWLLKLLAGLVALVVVAAIVVMIGARFADGPVEVIAGGPFTSGELYQGPEPDWTFVADRPTVEFQLLDPARSRTSWIIEHEGRIFIPCGYMDTTWGRLWKQWPIEAEQDGRALLRIDGTLYERQLVRIKNDPVVASVVAKIGAKYMGGSSMTSADGVAAVSNDSLWLFEMAPPSP